MNNQTIVVPDRDYKLDQQKAFDIAWKWANSHTRCVVEPLSNCLYRDGKGNACLLGAMIPDSLYTASMEMRNAAKLFKEFPAVRALFIDDDSIIVFIGQLQHCHDMAMSESGMIERLKCVAKSFDLIIPQ